jgi:hypothetical protein
LGVPFAMRWEVSSFLWNHGSFVEAAKVRPLNREVEPGDFWVERLHPDLKPALRDRVLRRWFLASQLSSPAWPTLVDAGDDGDRPWVVVEASGHRPDGTFPFADPQHALREVRGVAEAMAEAEGLVANACARPALAVRPALLSRTNNGRLMLQLAALDQVTDEGFPSSSALALFTPEELLGHPATARTNAFVLGWVLCLALTGRSPYDTPSGLDGQALREALTPLVLGGRVRALALPEALKSAEVLIRRSLAPLPGSRPTSAAAFAEALSTLAPSLTPRPRRAGPVVVAEPPGDVAEEWLPVKVEQPLLQRPDDRDAWLALAQTLEEARPGSTRSALIRAQAALDAGVDGERRVRAEREVQRTLALPGIFPLCRGERLELGWHCGYVRTVGATPDESSEVGEAKVQALVGLLQHPSLRFVRDLTLRGSKAHAQAWVEALARQPLPAMRSVSVEQVADTDPWAIEVAYRVPRFTWRWLRKPARGFFQRLFSRT